MKVSSYAVLCRAVEEGVAAGWAHAHKHTDTPSPEYVQAEIERGVMDAIGEVFTFDDDLVDLAPAGEVTP